MNQEAIDQATIDQPDTIQPGERFPSLTLRNADGGKWTLPDDCSAKMTMLVVYRGLHCGICKSYLAELGAHLHELQKLGVEVIAASADPRDKAKEAQQSWTDGKVPFGYGLDESAGRRLRLFLTAKRKEGEPDRFFEPGLYLITEDGVALFVAVQNMPFGRPGIAEITSRIGWVLENGIPPRGTVRY